MDRTGKGAKEAAEPAILKTFKGKGQKGEKAKMMPGLPESPAGPQGLYLFCLARRRLLPDLQGVGLDGRSPLCLAGFRKLAAVYCPVSLEEFCGPEADRRLQDLSWVGPRACRHQEVVEAVMLRSPVLPARFGTLFSSRKKLEQVLRLHHDTVARFLDQVADQEEWAVKGLLDRARALEAFSARRLAPEADRLGRLPPGRRYLEEQRLRSGMRQDLYAWVREVCLELAQELEDCALHWRERPVLDPGGNGDGQELILNWAFLVPKRAAGGFKARLEAFSRRCRRYGLTFEGTGPWPPYSFSPSLNLEDDP